MSAARGHKARGECFIPVAHGRRARGESVLFLFVLVAHRQNTRGESVCSCSTQA